MATHADVVPDATPTPTTSPSLPKVALLWATDGAPEPFLRPTGLALGPDGMLYVVDAGHHRIVALDTAGHVLRAWGSMGDDVGQFRFRRSDICPDSDPNTCEPDLGGVLAVAVDGAVYVADYANDRVQVFDPAGRPRAVWGSTGDGPGQFRRPRGIAVDAAGRVCVCDTDNHRLQVFEPNGRFLTEWGSRGFSGGAFYHPGTLVADPHGGVFVADLWNGRICRRDRDGQPLPDWPVPPTVLFTTVAFSRPSGMALAMDGTLYLVGGGQHVQQFEPNGSPRRHWRSDWRGEAQLERPAGIAIDGQGDVYVADAGANRVLKFRILTPTDR